MKNKSFIYIQIIGVSSENQGKEYGRKLLRGLIEVKKTPIYLETETESNVPLYEQFEFKFLSK